MHNQHVCIVITFHILSTKQQNMNSLFTSKVSEEANSFTENHLRNPIFKEIKNKHHAMMNSSVYAQVYKSATEQHIFLCFTLHEF